MSAARPPRRPLRSAGALFAGLIVDFVLSLGTDVVLHASGVFPPWGQTMADSLFALAFGYRLVFNAASGYVTARLAPDRPLGHALALGCVGLVLSLVGVVLTLTKGPELGPLWYPIAIAASALPCAWVGGRLFVARQRRGAGRGPVPTSGEALTARG
jgi:hypothetical protein